MKGFVPEFSFQLADVIVSLKEKGCHRGWTKVKWSTMLIIKKPLSSTFGLVLIICGSEVVPGLWVELNSGGDKLSESGVEGTLLLAEVGTSDGCSDAAALERTLGRGL